MTEIDEVLHCPECKSNRLIHDRIRGETVCEDCGLVVDDTFIDQGPEWRNFDDSKNKERAGPPGSVMLHDKGLTTTIDWRDRDSNGKSIPGNSRAQIYRLRKWHRRIRISNAAERNLAFALTLVDAIGGQMNLPKSVRAESSVLYKKAVQKQLIRGRSIDTVVAASIYAACRMCKVPRTIDEVAQHSSSRRKEIARAYRFMKKELRISVPTTTPENYIPRICSELHLSNVVQTKAFELLDLSNKKMITSGRGPVGLAGASVYLAALMSGERRTQREVSEIAGITEVTIRSRYKEMVKELELEVNI